MRSLPPKIERLLRKKGFFRLTPEERRAQGLAALRELEGSFPGDAQAALDALDPLSHRE